jgi:hypothetical protein
VGGGGDGGAAFLLGHYPGELLVEKLADGGVLGEVLRARSRSRRYFRSS